jgi:hypothetical protein
MTLSPDDDSGHRQQASSSEEEGYPNGSETDASATTAAHELETGPILVGEVPPPEDASSFERFWKACAEPHGPLGFALSEWAKLSSDEQWRACQRPSRNGTYAGLAAPTGVRSAAKRDRGSPQQQRLCSDRGDE